MSETRDLTEQLTRRLWPSFKRQLKIRFPSEDWIRCLYLLRAVRVSQTQVHILATLPASGRIIAAALNRLPLMREMLAPSFNISLTRCPDEYEIAEAWWRYKIDMRPKPWTRKESQVP